MDFTVGEIFSFLSGVSAFIIPDMGHHMESDLLSERSQVMRKWHVRIVMGLLVLVVAGVAGAQQVGQEKDVEWQAFLFGGMFTGDTFLRDQGGTPSSLKTENDFMIGLRAGLEQEYLGAELTLAGVFQDVDYETSLPTGDRPSDARTLLLGLNGLLYPAGNYIMDGRIRPFLTAGPGLAYLDTDSSLLSNEVIFDFNVGAGIKILLGDEGFPVLRLDWRWYYLAGSVGGLENTYHQELTLGLGIRF